MNKSGFAYGGDEWRAQRSFRIPVDNDASKPFEPKLKHKPNALRPLAIVPEYDESGIIVGYSHPYQYELDTFEVEADRLNRRDAKKPAGVEETPYLYVDTTDKLHEALRELKKEPELAVDVEHHSYRSFLGFTCLVQISSLSKDYLFDALALREDMHVLNEVFTNPKVLKVFHGAEDDIDWLQRDLALYVVNMFDTQKAAKVLNFERMSLAALLKRYCDIETNKKFQLADWRVRPLTDKLIVYARQDTRYLVYIYECMTNELLDNSNETTNLLLTVFERSNELCKKRYVKPVADEKAFKRMLYFAGGKFDNRQLFALRELFYWRDGIARQEDESCGYVLPNKKLVYVAKCLPDDVGGILRCCNTPIVRRYLDVILAIMVRARQLPLEKPNKAADEATSSKTAQTKPIA